MAGQVNALGTKNLADVVTPMMIAGQLARHKGIKASGRAMVGRHKATVTHVQAAAKVGVSGSKPPKKMKNMTFKQAAAAAVAAHKAMHGTVGKKQVIPPHAKAKATPTPAPGQTKGQMQGGVD